MTGGWPPQAYDAEAALAEAQGKPPPKTPPPKEVGDVTPVARTVSVVVGIRAAGILGSRDSCDFPLYRGCSPLWNTHLHDASLQSVPLRPVLPLWFWCISVDALTRECVQWASRSFAESQTPVCRQGKHIRWLEGVSLRAVEMECSKGAGCIWESLANFRDRRGVHAEVHLAPVSVYILSAPWGICHVVSLLAQALLLLKWATECAHLCVRAPRRRTCVRGFDQDLTFVDSRTWTQGFDQDLDAIILLILRCIRYCRPAA